MFSFVGAAVTGLLAQRNLGSDSKRERRRRRHNAASTTAAPAGLMDRDNPSNNNPNNPNPQRFHGISSSPSIAAGPSSSTSAGPAASVSGCLPARLPFSLPPVPPGYRLVITHRPMADTTDDPSQVRPIISIVITLHYIVDF